MATNFAALGGVADPRSGDQPDYIGTTRDTPRHNAQTQRRHSLMYSDSSITFEEYSWWAERSREYEKELSTEGAGIQGILNMLIGKKTKKETEGIQGVPPVSGGLVQPRPEAEKIKEAGGKSDDHSDRVVPTEKDADSDKASPQPNVDRYGITEDEWYRAQRAVRTATWGSVFYLITTDILGPFSVPWAISQMGYGPGAGLYIGFGILAAYSGSQLWRMFCGLDSTKFPLRNYGDLAFRVYGNWARLLANTLQSFQFFMNVTILIVSNGQGLGQMVAGRSGTGCICFVVAELVFMLCGFVLGQIRTLQRLGMLANLAVWLNIITIIMTMVVTNVYPPNYAASLASYSTPKGPITKYAYWPPTTELNDHINGLMQGVYSYGGATLFNELMAEMRRPHDFWKGLICAEFFIVSVYLIMGMVVYNAQGQFAFNPAYQGIPNSAYSWQTLGNALSYITGVIAALLYGNIGIKVFYASVFRDLFHFPPLDKKIGKWIWVGLVPVYWGLAFVVAAAIPQISYLSAFVGAACILQFSYTFPPILMVGYNCQKDDPTTPSTPGPGNSTANTATPKPTPLTDATVLTRVLEHGGTIVGKAVCENFSRGAVSANAATGPVHNPYAQGYSAGGSSSGTAALVASGAVDLGIGCDQGGSIRIPAALCGLWGGGVKATVGLVPYTGIASNDASVGFVGPMTRSGVDCALLLEVLAGADGLDDRQMAGTPFPDAVPEYAAHLVSTKREGVKGMRIGVVKEGMHPGIIDAGVKAKIDAAVVRFKELGAVVEEVSVPMQDQARAVYSVWSKMGNHQGMIGRATGRRQVMLTDLYERKDLPYSQEALSKFSAFAMEGMLSGELGWQDYPLAYPKAINLGRKLKDAYDEVLAEFDLLVMPTVLTPADPLPAVDATPREHMAKGTGKLENTGPFNMTGHPALAFPIGLVESPADAQIKVPASMQVVGRFWSEAKILQAACAWEQATDWKTF
ncbi:oligopeptide transporter protein [Hortaea werneckii]|nr:oligopeptide transporter protein [Hortaea werneckii]KAI7019007.1 oligopeptide transporter protein [Hortaea werneckii]